MLLRVLITLFQKMLWFIWVWATIHEILAIKISKKMLTQHKFFESSSTLKTNISEAVILSIINNANFGKCVTKPFRCIYVNCFNSLRQNKIEKIHILDNLRTINQEGKMEIGQIIPVYSCTVSNITVFNIYFWIWKCTKFIFIWRSHWTILICKIPQF